MDMEHAAILDNMHRGFARYEQYIAELEAEILHLQHQLSAAQKNLGKAEKALVTFQAHAQGLAAQVSHLAVALRKEAKSAPLLQITDEFWPMGTRFEGEPLSVAGAIYVDAVRKYLAERGVKEANHGNFYV